MANPKRQVFVEIPVDGEWPSPEDLNARDAVIDALDQRNIGEFIGSGGGLGNMDFSYRVSNEEVARQAIEATMARLLPNLPFTLEVSDDTPAPKRLPDRVPSSGSYIHDTCGQTTDVDGGDFKNLKKPVPGMRGTMCAACGSMFLINEFKWADTGEPILAYYERHRANVPALTKLLCCNPLGLTAWLLGLLAGIGFAIWCSSHLGWIWGILIGLVSSFVGLIAAILIWGTFTDYLINKALGVSDIRRLK